MVHEMGHDLNLPDLYDTNPANGDSYGVGEWSVMATGSWTFTGSNFEGSSPVHMDAFSKWYEGWLTPTQITGTQTGVQLTEMTNNADIYQLLDNPGSPRPVDWTFNVTSGTGEYFLVENRQQTGYDAGLPGCGLLIYHIDETRRSDNLANANETRRLVDVEEADGLNELDNDSDLEQGDAGDPYRGPKFFDRTSNPNSNLYSSAWSGVTVNNVSATCAPTMSADISVEEVPTFDLTVTKSGTGTGSVSSSPVGISCGDSCIKEYVGGIVVTLTATPTNGSKFVEWSDACTGNGPCRVTMDATKSVTATFIGKTTTTLTVSKTASKVKAKGSVKPAHAEDQVKITLYKRRSNGTWRRLATKTDTLNASSVYAKSFNRPNGGRCKMKTKFAADGDHLGSQRTKKFRC
jgi:hypothetical protein